MARLHPYSLALVGTTNESRGWEEDLAEQDRMFQKLLDKSASLPEGEIEGAVLQFPYADGYASYLVVKDSPLTLQHISYMDGWHLPAAHIRGLRKLDVSAMLNRQRALRVPPWIRRNQ